MTERTPYSEALDDVQIGKYVEIVGRRKWWIIPTATAIVCATLVFALRLPNFYHAETVILVDPQKVPDSYVSSTVTTTVSDRLSTIREEVMSPTRLTELIDRLGLYPEERAKGNLQPAITRMQKAITLEVVDAGGARLSAFKIGYTGGTPSEAARVPNELASMVIQENLEAQAQQTSGTSEFLETELEQTKKQLEDKEGELGRIKSSNVMDLPESKDFHLQALANLRAQLQSSIDRVASDQQQKVYLQSMMATTNPTIDLDSDGSDVASSPEEVQEQTLEAHLAELERRYGPKHPDVLTIKDEIKALKSKIAAEKKDKPIETTSPAQVGRPTVHNPVLEAQIAKIDQEIQDQAKLQRGLQEQIDFHSSKLEQEPIFEQKIGNLMRDYDALRDHYDKLLDKKLSADMYTALESRQEGERFVILDAASIPTKPAGPNRILFVVGALVAGLFAGTALAIGAETIDQSVRNEQQASVIFGTAVIAAIPVIVSNQDLMRRRLFATAAMTVTILSASGLGLLISDIVKHFG